MPRTKRHAPGSYVYHVLNRAVARLPLFTKPADYAAFERVLGEALQEHPTRLLAWCLMPNHFHLLVWPCRDGELSAFVGWLTHTHAMRWHTHYHTAGTGPVYQGRFKSFPVQEDDHYYGVLRYVERNALRAGLTERAEDWRWGSLRRRSPDSDQAATWLSEGPLPLPADWLERVNEPHSAAELAALRHAVRRNSPYGAPTWQGVVAARLGLTHTLRPLGRPKKATTPHPPQT